MSKVVTVHGHTLELDMGPSCPNPGIRRQLDAKGEPDHLDRNRRGLVSCICAQCSLRVAWYFRTG